MATYALVSKAKHWQGPDGEHLEITTADSGSTYHALNTGAQYIFHNGGWVEDLRQIYALTHV